MPTRAFHRIIAEAGELPTKKERAEFLAREKNSIILYLFKLTYVDDYKFFTKEIPAYRKGPPHDFGGYLYANYRMLNIFLEKGTYENISVEKKTAVLVRFLESLDRDDAELIELIILRKRFPKIDIGIVRDAFPELALA